jgi:hypothetical protein
MAFILVFVLTGGILSLDTKPAMADDATPVTITLLSGNTTQTAGYAYNNPLFASDTFVSGSNTETAGYTTTNPSAAPLDPGSYSGAWAVAQVINNTSQWPPLGGANWVSTTSANSGTENPTEGDAWRLYRATFNVTNTSTITSSSIQVAADNAFEFYFNGLRVDRTDDWVPSATVYGASPEPGGSTAPFEQRVTYNITPQTGTNTLLFVVRNWGDGGGANPTGLVYKVTLQREMINQQLNPAVYSGAGSWVNASIIAVQPASWTQTPNGAKWVSTTSEYSGTDDDYTGDAWRLFRDQLIIPEGATISPTNIQIAAADNAFEFYFNGTRIDTSANWTPECTVYGPSPEPGGSMVPFEGVTTYTINPHTGINTMMFVVRNWENGNNSNPTGLIYETSVTYTPTITPTPTPTVTPPPTPPTTVGGRVFEINKLQLVAPWAGLFLGLTTVITLTARRILAKKKA